MRAAIFLILSFISLQASLSQEKVSFYTEDNLKVTADLYLNDYLNPFILLFHQAGSSRGEYIDIAPKLMKLGYNCLAIDLRSGEKSNYIKNETAQRAIKEKIANRFIDAEKDIVASIDYVLKYNQKPVILFGSSYSASLALMVAKDNKRVEAVIAFSPGEYFRPELIVKEEIANLNLPVFIAASEIEYSYVKELASGLNLQNKTLFKPSNSRGTHGAKALWDSSSGNGEYWLNLTQFFRRLKEF
jgi:dienelactone hydrolase